MSRVVMLLLLAGVVLAVAALVVSVISTPATAQGTGRPQSSMVQKVSYGLLLAVMFGVASGALGEG